MRKEKLDRQLVFITVLTAATCLSPIAGSCQSSFTTSAEMLLQGGDAESLAVIEALGQSVVQNTTSPRSGKACFEFDKNTTVSFPEFIPVDSSKTYRLSAFMKSMDSANLASANFGLSMYDRDKRLITLRNVAGVNGTETELVEDAKNGGTSIVIANAGKWRSGSAVAFNILPDYQDLPNFDISPRIDKIEKKGSAWEVKLTGPLSNDFRKGTKVRMHSPWGAYLYWVADGWIPTEWTEYSTVISGEAKDSAPKDQFWAKTRFVRVTIRFGNWDHVPAKGARLLVDDVNFCEGGNTDCLPGKSQSGKVLSAK